LKEFYHHINTTIEPRLELGLPWSATPQVLPPSGSYVIEMANSRPLEIEQRLESNTIEVGFRGTVLTFNDAVLPLLDFLETRRSIQIETFYENFDEKCGHEEVRVFLTDLIKNGILSLVEPVG